jgi:hypothetical protein
MYRAIQNIIGILNGYGNGKLLESRKVKCRRKAGVKDLVSISDEARERFQSDADEINTPHADAIKLKISGTGDNGYDFRDSLQK